MQTHMIPVVHRKKPFFRMPFAVNRHAADSGDDQKQVLRKHIRILKCRIDARGDRRKHVIVRPCRRSVGSENILIKPVKGDDNACRHHSEDQHIQFSFRRYGVFHCQSRKHEDCGEKAHIETSRHRHRRDGGDDIQDGEQNDISVNRRTQQRLLPVPPPCSESPTRRRSARSPAEASSVPAEPAPPPGSTRHTDLRKCSR